MWLQRHISQNHTILPRKRLCRGNWELTNTFAGILPYAENRGEISIDSLCITMSKSTNWK